MVLAWIILVLLAAVTIELFFGANGFLLPLFVPSVFYLTMVFGWRRVLWVAVFLGLLIDAVLGRSFLAAAIVVGPVCLVAVRWNAQSRELGYWGQVPLVFLLGLIYGLLVLVGEMAGGLAWPILVRLAWPALLKTALMASMAGLPMYRVLDEIALRAELPGLFSNPSADRF